jgi:hypothetical protein
MTCRVAAVLAVMMIAGCGGESRTPAPAKPAAAPHPLVYMSRNTLWAVPDDVTVYANGRVDYRLLLHTKVNMKVRRTTLAPPALASLQRLVAGTRLAGADRAGSTQPRNGFTYLLRIGGQSITTVDGKLTPGVRPLIRRLGRLQDRMLLRGE